MSSRPTNRRKFEHVTPSLLIPDHFVCNQETRMVVLYDDPVGDENERMTLQFPGDVVGSSPRQITTRRVGSQTIVFNTPVYSTSRGQVEVTPILESRKGYKIQLGAFRLTLKHPLTTAMELCMNLSSSTAVLPVLTTLMLNASGEKTEQFKDSHTDRMMTLLVGSMKPGTSCTIQDILLPDKKWKKKNLTDLAQKFNLRSMEKEAYAFAAQRRRPRKNETTKKRNEEVVRALDSSPNLDAVEDEEEAVITASFSSPAINTVGLDETAELEPVDVDRVSMWNQMKNDVKRVYVVKQDFYTQEPGKISLKIGQKVYVVTSHSREAGWWYGASDGKHGLFPAVCVEATYQTQENTRRMLPLPPLPRKTPFSATDKRLSLPFKKPGSFQQPAIPQKKVAPVLIPSKAYKRSPNIGLSPSSISSNKADSEDFLFTNESGEYVDMVAAREQDSTDSESENDSNAEDQQTAFHGTRQPIPLPSRATNRIALPVPPAKTTSVKYSYEECTESESESSQPEDEDDSDDDKLDYVNLNEQGFPLTGAELKKKLTKYENFNPLSFDLVQGHMYDLPDQLSPEKQTSPHTETLHPTQYPAAKTPIWPSDHHPESEARSQSLFNNQRKTHENVVLSPTKLKIPPVPPPKIAPVPPPKPTGQAGSPNTSRTKSVSARVNWLKQELQTTSKPTIFANEEHNHR